jgi:hypothetical protein
MTKWKVLTLTLLCVKKYFASQKKLFEEILKEMEKLPATQDSDGEDNDGGGGGGDDDNTVSDEHVMPPPNYEDALLCVSQLIKCASAHRPQFIDNLFHMYGSIETQ